MRSFGLIASIIVLAAAAATPAHAYRYRTCTTGTGTVPLTLPGDFDTVHYSTTSFPVSGGWIDALNNTISQYNRNPSNFFLKLAADTNGVNLNNGESETWGSTDQTILNGAPAIAYSYWDCNFFTAKMKEGDVIFDYTNTVSNPFQWTPVRSKSALWSYTNLNGKRLLQGTAMHEFGHASGLLHESRTYNVMGTDFTHLDTSGSTVNAYVGEDTGNALVFLYGLWSAGPLELGVAHWRYTGFSGEYSTHGRTRMFNSAGALLSKTMVAAEPRYNVTRGSTVKVEFTYENMGRATVSSIPVRFYISTDDVITTADRQIGSTTIGSLARDWVSTLKHSVAIPSNLSANTSYWLGVIVNPTSSITETYRDNNTSYIRIRTN